MVSPFTIVKGEYCTGLTHAGIIRRQEVQHLVKQHQGIEATLEKARRFAEAAQADLAPFPPSPAKHALLNMLHFIQTRTW